MFTKFRDAKKYVATRDAGVVIKAAGLAKGKGVYVCAEPHLAVRPLEQIMVEKIFGAAGELDTDDCRVRMNIAAGARDTQAFLEQISFYVNVLAKVNE